MKKIIALIITLILALTLVACGDDANNGQKDDPTIPVSIVIKAKVAKVQINNKLKLTYSITPATAQNDRVSVTVSDESLASVAITGSNSIELTAGSKIGSVRVTVTTSNGIAANKTIKIQEEPVDVYPDLSGYDIKIAQAEHALGEYDVRLTAETADKYGFYDNPDREFKIQAWDEIEDNYNCTMSIVAYPSDAPWGPSRWSYILTQAQNDAPEYDFYIAESYCIPQFVAGNAVVDMTDLYKEYGNNLMGEMAITASSYKGKLYAICPRETNVTNLMGYNYGLWEKLHEANPALKEPAQMYLDGEWNYSNFLQYCIDVQKAMETLYGTEDSYYAVSGTASYYWLGMVNAAGVKIFDTTQLKANIAGATETAAAQTLHDIFAAGAMDPSFQVDGSVATWNAGHSLFNTGSLWFVNSGNRWSKTLWTDEEHTKYGYVPFPTSDDSPITYVGTSADGFLVMSTGREWAYKGFGDECTTENIYRAVMDYYNTAKKFYTASEDYDKVGDLQKIATSKFGSEASVKAYLQIMLGKQNAQGEYENGIDEIAFFDPFTGSNNVADSVSSDFAKSINNFIKGVDANQWIDAVGTYQASLEKSLVEQYG